MCVSVTSFTRSNIDLQPLVALALSPHDAILYFDIGDWL